MENNLWIPSFGIPDAYKFTVGGFVLWYYLWIEICAIVYVYSPIPLLGGFMQLVTGNYARYGLPYGFFGELVWAYYSTFALPQKVILRNATFIIAYANATFAAAYTFTSSFSFAVLYKLLWPELLEFDIDEINSRGSPPTLAEATAIHYWGEQAGKAEDQSILWLFVGQYTTNYLTMFMTIAFSTVFLPQLLESAYATVSKMLGSFAVVLLIVALPLVIVYAVI